MEEVWLFIGLVVAGCIVVVTFYFAMVLREVLKNLQDMRGTVRNMNIITSNLIREQEMVDDVIAKVQETATEVSEGVSYVRNQVLAPVTFFSSLIQAFRENFDRPREE